MKTITTALVLAGVVLTAPSYADLEWNKTDPIKMAAEPSNEDRQSHVTDAVNPQNEALKKHVNAALDAHKGKAPKGMKGQKEEMKAYVGKALDAQAREQMKLRADTENMNLQQSLEYVYAWNPVGDLIPERKKKMDDCFPTPTSDPTICVTRSVSAGDALMFLNVNLETRCTGDIKLPIIGWVSRGTCANPEFKKACIMLDSASQLLPGKLIEHCVAACTEPNTDDCK